MSPAGDPYPFWTTGRGEAAAGASSLPSSFLCHPPSLVKKIVKEEHGDCTEKWFHETKGKYSPSGERRWGMTQGGVDLILTVDKWEMGWDEMSLVWAGQVAERAHGLCAPFPLLPFLRKVRNGTCEWGWDGNLIMKKSSISGSRGAPSHKYMRVHNNLKSEDLLLE